MFRRQEAAPLMEAAYEEMAEASWQAAIQVNVPMMVRNFIVEVDPSNENAKTTSYDDFQSLCQHVTEILGPAGHTKSAGDSGLLTTADEDHEFGFASGRFTWINVCHSSAAEVSRLGALCGLHTLTVEDVTTDHQEKCELFLSLGYMYCVIESEDVDGKTVPVHVIVSDRWVLTFHDNDCCAVRDTLHRLNAEYGSLMRSSVSKDQVAPTNCPSAPVWVLYSLLDMDIDYMIPGCENLVGQAMEMDQLVFLVSSKEQADVLRRLSVSRSSIYGLKQRIFARQRLLAVLLSTSVETFVPSSVKFYLRDVCDHVIWCDNRLNFADQVLSLANNNYLACINTEAICIANNTNTIMRKFTVATLVFTSYMVVISMWGMNVMVPWRDNGVNEDLTPFFGIVLGFGCGLLLIYFTYHWWDKRREKRHHW